MKTIVKNMTELEFAKYYLNKAVTDGALDEEYLTKLKTDQDWIELADKYSQYSDAMVESAIEGDYEDRGRQL